MLLAVRTLAVKSYATFGELMSRIGRQPISIPDGVTVSVDGNAVHVTGPKGELHWESPDEIDVVITDRIIVITRTNDLKQNRARHGLTRALINNMVTGVFTGFTKTLEIQGTGYRAELDGSAIVLRIGFSHPVRIEPLPGIDFLVQGNLITIQGYDKQVVGQQAAEIRRIRPPEPYKGKGIRYQGEWVRRKTGKGAIT